MAEWSIAAVLKTVELKGSGGSNPSFSAEKSKKKGDKRKKKRLFNKFLNSLFLGSVSLLSLRPFWTFLISL